MILQVNKEAQNCNFTCKHLHLHLQLKFTCHHTEKLAQEL